MAYDHGVYPLLKLILVLGYQFEITTFKAKWKNNLIEVVYWVHQIIGVASLISHVISTTTRSIRYMPEFFQRLFEDAAFNLLFIEAHFIRANFQDLHELIQHMETSFSTQETEIVEKTYAKAKFIFYVCVTSAIGCLSGSILETFFTVSQEELDLLSHIYDRKYPNNRLQTNFWVPDIDDSEPPYYQIIFVTELYLIYLIILLTILSVSLIPMLVTHIAGQYEILCNRIQSLGHSSIMWNKRRPIDDLQDRESLRSIMQAHKNLISAQSKVFSHNNQTLNTCILSVHLANEFKGLLNTHIPSVAGAMAHNKSRRAEPNVAELLIFGYSCKLFRDDEKALYIDQGKHLIPWMGDDSIKIDRYDGRGALYDLKQHEPLPGGYDSMMSLTNEERRVEQMCDEERYYALNKDEDVDLLYQEEELKRLQEAGKEKLYGQVGFTYDDDSNDKEDVKKVDEENGDESDVFELIPQLDIPVNTVLPTSKKHFAIIEKTASFINSQGAQMEILLKMKQASNPHFGFLSFDNPLYPFYRHVLSAIQSGRYMPGTYEQQKSSELNSSSEQEDYLHPSLQVPTMSTLPESICNVAQDYRMVQKISSSRQLECC
ncbi:hypothetical protein M8J76_000620 [Diaphorina citri]|nr:hypothetical protein M8J76_000620 [Diaphorina citri]